MWLSRLRIHAARSISYFHAGESENLLPEWAPYTQLSPHQLSSHTGSPQPEVSIAEVAGKIVA